MDYKKNYYHILEVSPTASKEEIRAAYRRLAKLYHPDKNAGNLEAEEIFKQINEANEVLSNEILRHEYDAYKIEEAQWQKAQAEKEAVDGVLKQANKKTYIRTKTVTTETRIYIRGEISVKYWADCKEEAIASYDTELDYKINPTEAVIVINEQNIFPFLSIPINYLKAFKESDIFAMPISQPIRCEVNSVTGKEHFELTLHDIRIKNIRLEGITKHDKNSYGTLKGDFYGYTPKFTSEEIEEEVTECFGETGRVERREEGGVDFFRKEYYHPDCSIFWGAWIQLPKAGAFADSYPSAQKSASPDSSSYGFNKNYTNRKSNAYTDIGCALPTGIVTLITLLLIAPKLFIFCLVLGALALLFNYGDKIFSSIGKFLSFVFMGLLLLFIITAVRSISDPGRTYVKKKARAAETRTASNVREIKDTSGAENASADTLITHYLKWEDYAGRPYEAGISVSVAAVRNASAQHKFMNRSFYQDMSEIYKTLLENDSSRLAYLYQAFDSIKAANRLDEVSFSQVLVSAIQSQPYFLVLDKGCDDDYSDDFTRNYLANCTQECCIGNELFGVRSPVEFLSDLKGDCDTRSLLLYSVLKHYNYEVALLTSNYYKHAMIAVNFDGDKISINTTPGMSVMIGEKKYYMWETTSSSLDYGQISSSFNNPAFWDISLLNKKK